MRSNNSFTIRCKGEGDFLKSTEIFFSSQFEIQCQNCSHSLERQTKEWFESYFDGSPSTNLPQLNFSGTPFQQLVWNLLQEIPFGETRTYAQIAEKTGIPKGSRAVGNACGKNRFILLIPCHRVIRSDATLGGFAIDLAIKQHLINFEEKRVLSPSR